MEKHVLIYPSGIQHANLGDLAMLQVAVARILKGGRGARVTVLTDDVPGLKEFCPGAEGLHDPAWGGLFHQRVLPYRIRRLAPFLGLVEDRCIAALAPGIHSKLLRAKRNFQLAILHRTSPFLEAIEDCDVLVFSGMGGFTDTFEKNAIRMAELIDFAIERRRKVFLFGQGIGPLRKHGPLWRVCRSVFPHVERIACREGLHSPRMLESLGVPSERIVVTGDDALELVAGRSQNDQEGRLLLGINLRAAPHSGITVDDAARIGRTIARVVQRIDVTPVTIPIARYSIAPDELVVQEALQEAGIQPERTKWSVEDVILSCGKLAAMVTISYHAGVFAAGQGVPVIGLATNEYYRYKFEGLQFQFAKGIKVLNPFEPEFECGLLESVRHFVTSGGALKKDLCAKAFAQVKLSRRCYEDFHVRIGLQ